MIETKNQSLSPQSSRDLEGTVSQPRIKIINPVYDFGEVGPGTQSRAVFDFKNIGTGVLKIQGVQPTCRSTFLKDGVKYKHISKEGPLILEPGQSAQVEVAFTAPSSKWKFQKSLYLRSNDPDIPRARIEIMAEVIVKVEVSPEKVELLLDQENGGMEKILLKSIDGQEFSIQEIKIPNSVMTIPFDPEIKAKQFLLEAIIDIEKLAHSPAGAIQIVTDHPNGDKPMIRYKALPQYELSRSRIMLQNVSPKQEIIRQVLVQGNYGKTAKIKSAQSRNGYVKIVNQQESDGQVQLEIAVVPPKQDKRYFTDTLTIILEDGYELTVRCTGWYKKRG